MKSAALISWQILSFADLIEARFIDAFRSYDVSLQAIRIAAERAQEIIQSSHPFSTKSFLTDGNTIIAQIEDDTDDPKMLDLIRNQYGIRKVIRPYLHKGLEYQEDEPNRWWPLGKKRSVFIDPAHSFGAPVVSPWGIRTSVINATYQAEQSDIVTARWYGITETAVARAVEYEEQLAAV